MNGRYNWQPICDICGKPNAGVRNMHAACSRKRQQRRQLEQRRPHQRVASESQLMATIEISSRGR